MMVLKVLLGLLGISLIVIVHEWGHYMAAKLSGIVVEVFSLGWGKRLWGIRRGDTEYRLSLLPLGGYCKLKGEESLIQAQKEKSQRVPQEPGTFYSASIGKRIFVSLAGPAANLLFSFIVLTIIAWGGYQEYYREPKIGLASQWLSPGTSWPADEAGLQSGDVIKAVEGQDIYRFQQLQERIALSPGESLSLTVEREGRLLQTTVKPVLNEEATSGVMGVFAWVDPRIDSVSPGSPAEQAGLRPQDKIIKAGGKSSPHTQAVIQYIREGKGPLNLEVLRGGETHKIQISPLEGELGITFALPRRLSPGRGFPGSLGEGAKETGRFFLLTIKSIRMLYRGIRIDRSVSGPLRLTWYVGEAAILSFANGIGPGMRAFFGLLAFISTALAFMNLLPIPVLDGGQIMLFLFEAVKRSPLTPKTIYRYQFVGSLIVIALVIFVTASDILFFTGG